MQINGHEVAVILSDGIVKIKGKTNCLINIEEKVEETDYAAVVQALQACGVYRPDYRGMILDLMWEAIQCENKDG